MTSYLIFTVGIIILITVLEWFAPAVFRPTNLFGVTVAPDAARQRAGRAVIRRWRIGVTAVGIGGIVLALVAPVLGTGAALLVRSGVIALVAFAQVALYIAAHHQAGALAVPEGSVLRVASLGPTPRGALVPLWWEALPLALIGVTAVALAQQYAAAPAVIPVHWDINSQVDRYAPKTVGTFFFMVWMQLILYVVLTLVTLTVGATRFGNAAGTGSGRYRVALARFLFFIKNMVILLLGTMGLVIANDEVTNTPPTGGIFLPPLLFVLVIFVAGGILFVRYGQSGWRLDGASSARSATDNMPDSAWKGGLIYYNPDDPALFVERRSGLGTTLNFGHPGSWLFLGALLVVIIGASVVPVLLSGK